MNNNMTLDNHEQNEGAEGAKKGFRIHLTVFLCVSALLTTINLTFYPGFLWAIFPVVGMGIGLACHGIGMKMSRSI